MPWLTKQDIPFNVHFGCLNDEQVDWINEKIIDVFPGVNAAELNAMLSFLKQSYACAETNLILVTMKQKNTYKHQIWGNQ